MNQEPTTIHAFEHTWEREPGLRGYFTTVNNQPLGKRFMATSLTFFLFGGILALLMRIQLAFPENDFIGPDLYNQIFTMHGSTMMFLFAVPFMEGLALYILPMMIGSRDVSFPRLSAFSYWTYLFGGILFFVSIFTGSAPDAGWFAYTPLSGPKYSGIGIDFWVLGLGLVEISGIATGIELAVTILKMRAQGMPLNKMPLFVWTILVMSIMIIFAFTVLLMATFMLEMDRMIGTRFFDTDFGGNSLLWQHLFWFFGHPEVYIMFLPATGIVSTIVSTFARRPVVGYLLVVTAIVVMGFVSFGLWVHHMFATGLPELASAFFTGASLIIAVASGIQIFAWIATLWGTRPAYKTPFLFVLGFFFIFVLGGLTGVMVAVVPFDLQVHDTYFIVAHFHYVLIGGVVFPAFGGLAYWLPKITGKMMSETLGRWSFGLTFIGFNLTFFPMHIMGMVGMPRRVYTYPKELNLGDSNLLASVGAFIMGAGFLIFIFNILRSLKKGLPAGNNPWGAHSLEWSLTSPPPIYSFVNPPKYQEQDGVYVESAEGPLALKDKLNAAPVNWRATPVTNTVNGEIEAVQWLPGPTFMPFISACGIAVFFLGLLLKLYLLSAVTFILFAGLVIQWLWPYVKESVQEDAVRLENELSLSFRPHGFQSPVWWGMIGLFIVLTMAVGSQIFSYFYLWLYSPVWPQNDLPVPDAKFYLGSLMLMAGAYGCTFWGKREIQKETYRLLFSSQVLGLFLSVVSIALLFYQVLEIPFSHITNAYASSVHVLHWLQLGFLLPGAGLILGILSRMMVEKTIILNSILLQGQVNHLYWLFVLLSGIGVGATVYLAPLILN